MRAFLVFLLAFPACDSKDDTGGPPAPDTSGNADQDGDGWTVDEGDCDDADPAVNPGATEVACDFTDNDCSGGDLADEDRDGHNCEAVGGDDCDDRDAGTHPGVAEDTCGDRIDRDCDGDDECDCDADEWDSAACKGSDCDDADPAVHPNAADDVPNGMDDDCDGVVDQDAYCNRYTPTSNGAKAERTYATFRDDTDYTEVVTITAWDEGLGRATVERRLTDTGGGTREAAEAWTCDEGVMSVTGFAYEEDGKPVATIVYDEPRTFLLAADTLEPGEEWSYEYTASDAVLGDLWTTIGTCTVLGVYDSIKVTAGTFSDALEIRDEYVQEDLQYGTFDAEGTAFLWYVPGLGLVFYEDRDSDGVVQESRELQSYTGFYP